MENKIRYQISYEDHLKSFDGLPTVKKLEILNRKKLVPKKLNKKIRLKKNQITRKLLEKNIHFNDQIFFIFKNFLKNIK